MDNKEHEKYLLKVKPLKADTALFWYLREIQRQGKLLTAEQEIDLFEKFDRRSRHKLITKNMPLVVNIARKYQNRGFGLLNLISIGTKGLIEAVDSFDIETTKVKLSTHIYMFVKRNIIATIYKNASFIRLPVNQLTILYKITRIKENWLVEKDYPINTSQLLIELKKEYDGYTMPKLLYLQKVAESQLTLDMEYFDQNNLISLVSLTSGGEIDSPAKYAENLECKNLIIEILQTIDLRNREIFKKLYKLDDDKFVKNNHTIKGLAEEYKLSYHHIARIKRDILKVLRKNKKLQKFYNNCN